MRAWILLVTVTVGCSGAGELEFPPARKVGGSVLFPPGGVGGAGGGGAPGVGGGGGLVLGGQGGDGGVDGDGGDASSSSSSGCDVVAACEAASACGVAPTACGDVDCGPCALPEMCGDNGVEHTCGFVCLSQYEPNCAAALLPSAWGVKHGCSQPYRVVADGFALRPEGIEGCAYLYVSALQQYECCP